MRHTSERLPADRPRYLMGVGHAEDIAEAVASGIDMFDCVLPTRNARTAGCSPASANVKIRNARYRDDTRALDATCPCTTCTNFSARLPAPSAEGERDLGARLNTLHNLHYYQTLMRELRGAIAEGGLGDYLVAFRKARGELGKTG